MVKLDPSRIGRALRGGRGESRTQRPCTGRAQREDVANPKPGTWNWAGAERDLANPNCRIIGEKWAGAARGLGQSRARFPGTGRALDQSRFSCNWVVLRGGVANPETALGGTGRAKLEGGR